MHVRINDVLLLLGTHHIWSCGWVINYYNFGITTKFQSVPRTSLIIALGDLEYSTRVIHEVEKMIKSSNVLPVCWVFKYSLQSWGHTPTDVMNGTVVLEAPELLLDGGGAGQWAGDIAKYTWQGPQFGHRRLQEGIVTLGWRVTTLWTTEGNHMEPESLRVQMADWWVGRRFFLVGRDSRHHNALVVGQRNHGDTVCRTGKGGMDSGMGKRRRKQKEKSQIRDK